MPNSDPNVRKEWMKFIFNEVSDVSKNLISPQIRLQTRHTLTGFSERLKLKDDAVPTIMDPTVMSKSVGYCFYYMVTIAMYWVFMRS